MVDDFKSSVDLGRLDRRHNARQKKKDDRFQTDLNIIFSDGLDADRERLRKEREKKYLDQTFGGDD